MRPIDADALKEHAYPSGDYNRETQDFDLPVVEVYDIDDAPTLPVLPLRYGHIQLPAERRSNGSWEWTCSLCGTATEGTELNPKSLYEHYHYCKSCGARLVPHEIAPDEDGVVIGEWVCKADRTYCSVCGKDALIDSYDVVHGKLRYHLSPYCPHCGIQMERFICAEM